MRQRLLWLLVRLTLILSLMVLSMVPLDAFAGTTASANHSATQHRPHFFMDGELSVVGGRDYKLSVFIVNSPVCVLFSFLFNKEKQIFFVEEKK